MKKPIFIILALTMISGGCSTASLFYRNADLYLQHKIYDYTTFNARQKETIRKEVSDYMLWHRKEALPEYIIFLQNLNGATQSEDSLSAKEVALLRVQLMDLYKKTMFPAIRPTAQLLSELDRRQIQELGRSFAEQIRQQKDKFLEDGKIENFDKRAERAVDFVDWLAGSLSNEQEQKIAELSRKLPGASLSYIQQREANQAKLITLLNDHAGAEKIAAFLTSWILTPEATRTSQQQRNIQSFESGSDETFAQIHGMLTPGQKSHIRKLISSYIRDIRNLESDSTSHEGARREDLHGIQYPGLAFNNRTCVHG